MYSDEVHAAGRPDKDAKVVEHEQAAHQKRNWVRLTYDCNDRCIFCLDSDTHDGEMRAREEVKRQILDGRRKGAERLILSGGEPTIHPDYVDFVRLGHAAGYARVQTVTNGRMFAYPEFLSRCLDAGLGEITFSIHGPNAKVHDALVGVQGAYEEEIKGLEAALADGRPIVNIDVCVNRGNVKHLAEMLRKYIAMGVREFDLLQIIPFGRAFTEGRDILFYDLEEMRPHLLAAFEFSKQPDIHLWLNRFPVQHLEGFEHLIQDPYKLNDEVRGRKEEFAGLLDHGVQLDCREPERCRYCYVERLCDHLETVRDTVASQKFEVVRIDTEWEASQPPVYGGDPASTRRLPIVGAGSAPPQVPSIEALVEASGASTVSIKAPDLEAASAELERFPTVTDVELELGEYRGLDDLLTDGKLAGKRLLRAVASTREQAQRLLEIDGSFEVLVAIGSDTAAWLSRLDEVPARIALRQPTHERLTQSAELDVDLRELFSTLKGEPEVEGVPACVLGRRPRAPAATLDTTMMTPEGRLEIFRYAKRFIVDHYLVKSLRCRDCTYDSECAGMHVNYVRAHGFGVMQPISDQSATGS